MENSKKRRHRAICPECGGNGYKQFQIQKDGKLNEDKKSTEHVILQCDICNSEGEIYVDESEIVESYIDADNLADDEHIDKPTIN
jgi:phage terminase large subunit GpA-like protein